MTLRPSNVHNLLLTIGLDCKHGKDGIKKNVKHNKATSQDSCDRDKVPHTTQHSGYTSNIIYISWLRSIKANNT